MSRGGHREPSEPLTCEEAIEIFGALAQRTRLEAFRILLRYHPHGLSAGELSRLLGVPHNSLSGHMAVLQATGLVKSRRMGRRIIFAAEPATYIASEAFLAQGLGGPLTEIFAESDPVTYPTQRPAITDDSRVVNVLFLCNGNSARSIMAEAILNREGDGRFRAYSAGSRPKSAPNPLVLEMLGTFGYDTAQCRSKSWLQFAARGAPKMDIVITVCDAVAGEECPRWPGHPIAVHWGLADPSKAAASDEELRAALYETYRSLSARITALVNLPVAGLREGELKSRLAALARMDGATALAMALS